MDPGKVNFAWVLWDRGQVIESGWVTPLGKVNDDAEFITDFIELLCKTTPEFVVIERFMIRNRGQSVLAEIINQMIGRIAILTKTHAALDVIQ